MPLWNEAESTEDSLGYVVKEAGRLVGCFVGDSPEVAAKENGAEAVEE